MIFLVSACTVEMQKGRSERPFCTPCFSVVLVSVPLHAIGRGFKSLFAHQKKTLEANARGLLIYRFKRGRWLGCCRIEPLRGWLRRRRRHHHRHRQAVGLCRWL
jgi:hypothetical protein